jgi:MFS transporter, Spinster family, sphingosine-1-phosphate transporter
MTGLDSEHGAAEDTPARERPLARGWIVVAALWPVVMLNYLDRQMLATIRVSMRADIPSIASDQDFGTLMAVFMWTYAVLSPLGGYCADRLSRRWTVIGSLFVWSAVTWLTGHMHSYRQLLATRALMGISEALYMPAALALIADYHPRNTRARAIGIHQSGLYFGLILSGVGGYIAQSSSWRNCFTWFGWAGMIYALALMPLLRDAPTAQHPAEAHRPRLGGTLRALWGQPAFWVLCVCFTLPGVAGWVVKNWLPTFLADRFGLSEGPAGMSATVYVQLASLAGVLLGGALADRWMLTTRRGRIRTSALGMALMAPATLGMGGAWSIAAAVGCMVLFGLGWGLFDSNSMPILCQIAAPRHRATGYGFMNLVGISVGAGVTVLLGCMRDRHLPFAAAFAVSAGLVLLSAILVLFIKPRPEVETS